MICIHFNYIIWVKTYGEKSKSGKPRILSPGKTQTAQIPTLLLAKCHNNMIVIKYYFDFCPDKPNCNQWRIYGVVQEVWTPQTQIYTYIIN